MRECGCFPATILAQPHRPCRPHHPYAVPRTFLQCVCTRRRNCTEQLSTCKKYAPGVGPLPARKSAILRNREQPIRRTSTAGPVRGKVAADRAGRDGRPSATRKIIKKERYRFRRGRPL